MIKKEVLKKINIRWVIVAAIVATIILIELIFAEESFFTSNIVAKEYKAYEDILCHNLEQDGNTYYLKGANSYMVVPADCAYTTIKLYIDSKKDSEIIVRAYYHNNDGFSFKDSIKRTILPEDKYVEFENSKRIGAVKLQFIGEGDGSTSFKLKKIEFSNARLLLNKIFILKVMLTWCVLYIFVSLLLYLATRVFGDGKNSIVAKTIFLSGILTILIFGLTKSYYLPAYFHGNLSDTFMDYFNMIKLTFGDDVYCEKANWPAMCFVILTFMKSFLNRGIVSPSIDAHEIRNNEIAMIGCIFIFIASIYLVAYSLKRLLRKQDEKNIIVLLLSGPIIYLVERGNLLVISLALLMLYFLYYDSDNKKLRYLSYLALSISASIKLYPAVFGLLTLKRKNKKETILLVFLGAVTFLLPFFYFDGVVTIKKWLDGMNAANGVLTSSGVGNNYSFRNIISIMGYLFGVNIEVPGWLALIILVALLAMAFIDKYEWECLFLIATACVWFPYFSFTYMLVLYIPAVVAYLNEEDAAKKTIDGFLLALTQSILILPMWPWIDSLIDAEYLDLPMNFSTLVINIAIIILFVRVARNLVLGRQCSRFLKIEFAAVISLMIIASICIYNRSSGYEYAFKGKGTSWNPYRISSVEDWMKLQQIVNEGDALSGVHFVQTEDIVFDGVTSVDPIGWGKPSMRFDGIFDGQGYCIKNFYSLSDSDENMGLFGRLSGQVCNVCMENCNIAGSIVGGIAYDVARSGKISNCYVNGILYGYKVAGIAAMNGGTIENCAAFVCLDGTKKYGIAENLNSEMNNCYTNEKYNVTENSIIDEKTIQKLNNFIKVNNDCLDSEYQMQPWQIQNGLFLLENVGD